MRSHVELLGSAPTSHASYATEENHDACHTCMGLYSGVLRQLRTCLNGADDAHLKPALGEVLCGVGPAVHSSPFTAQHVELIRMHGLRHYCGCMPLHCIKHYSMYVKFILFTTEAKSIVTAQNVGLLEHVCWVRRVSCWGRRSRYNVCSGPIFGVDTVPTCAWAPSLNAFNTDTL